MIWRCQSFCHYTVNLNLTLTLSSVSIWISEDLDLTPYCNIEFTILATGAEAKSEPSASPAIICYLRNRDIYIFYLSNLRAHHIRLLSRIEAILSLVDISAFVCLGDIFLASFSSEYQRVFHYLNKPFTSKRNSSVPS